MTEVCNCGEGHRTRLKSTCVSMGCPLPTYIKEGGEEEAAKEEEACLGGNPTPSMIPPFSYS